MRMTGADGETGAETPRGPLWWPRRRSVLLDVTLAAGSAAECAAQGASFAHEARLPVTLSAFVGALVGASLVVRRAWPIPLVLLAVAVTPANMGFLLGVVALYTLAASEVPRRITGMLAAMSVLGTLIITMVRFRHEMASDGYEPPTWVALIVAVLMALGLTAPPVLLGLYVGARRRLVESLRERADGLERELSLLADRAEERAEWARNEERTRIAREMHDVVAHRVSLMVVHAAALQRVALKDRERASKNAELVADMGRQALDELRQMLGVLRSKDGPTGTEPVRQRETAERAAPARPAAPTGAAPDARTTDHSPAASVTDPPADPADASRPAAPATAAGPRAATGDLAGPRLAGLATLVEQSRAAGMVVELDTEGGRRRYAAPVEKTAYRVVQEALTNVHKHAPGATARVRLAYREAEVAVLVENGPCGESATDAGLPSGGNGLVGMAERVATLGGGFVYGATDAGGFRVSAMIPDRATPDTGTDDTEAGSEGDDTGTDDTADDMTADARDETAGRDAAGEGDIPSAPRRSNARRRLTGGDRRQPARSGTPRRFGVSPSRGSGVRRPCRGADPRGTEGAPGTPEEADGGGVADDPPELASVDGADQRPADPDRAEKDGADQPAQPQSESA